MKDCRHLAGRMPMAESLEDEAIPDVQSIIDGVHKVLYHA